MTLEESRQALLLSYINLLPSYWAASKGGTDFEKKEKKEKNEKAAGAQAVRSRYVRSLHLCRSGANVIVKSDWEPTEYFLPGMRRHDAKKEAVEP